MQKNDQKVLNQLVIEFWYYGKIDYWYITSSAVKTEMAVNLPLIENKPSKCYKVSINDHNPNFMKYIDPSGDPQFWNEVSLSS